MVQYVTHHVTLPLGQGNNPPLRKFSKKKVSSNLLKCYKVTWGWMEIMEVPYVKKVIRNKLVFSRSKQVSQRGQSDACVHMSQGVEGEDPLNNFQNHPRHLVYFKYTHKRTENQYL
jgi:hypothetical protein